MTLNKPENVRSTEELRTFIMSSLEFRLKNPDLPYCTSERNIIIKEFEGGLRLFIDLSDNFIGLNIIRGLYEPSEIEFARQFVKPGQTVLDIGANIGFFTMTMASLVGPSGRVYAFEPLDQHADLLERSIAENGFENRVRLGRLAVGESSGSVRLFFPKPPIASGGAYMLNEDVAAPNDCQTKNVQVISLDDYELRHPIGFIKIDVEGAEPLAFRGAERTLRNDRPIILSELHPVQLNKVSRCAPAEYVSQMEAYGFDCHLLEGGQLVGKIADLDDSQIRSVVFLPRSGQKAAPIAT